MSDFYILESAKNKKTVNTVFHIPIPTGNNIAGVAWRTALVSHLGGADAITSILIDISTAELDAMKAGELYEQIKTVRFSSTTLTDAQRLAQVEAAYNAAQADALPTLQARLKYYGYVGDV